MFSYKYLSVIFLPIYLYMLRVFCIFILAINECMYIKRLRTKQEDNELIPIESKLTFISTEEIGHYIYYHLIESSSCRQMIMGFPWCVSVCVADLSRNFLNFAEPRNRFEQLFSQSIRLGFAIQYPSNVSARFLDTPTEREYRFESALPRVIDASVDRLREIVCLKNHLPSPDSSVVSSCLFRLIERATRNVRPDIPSIFM